MLTLLPNKPTIFVNMKKLIISLVAVLTVAAAHALPFDIANHLGIGVGVGTNGITVEAATPITKFVGLRAGVSFMPAITFNADADFTYTVPDPSTNSSVSRQGEVELEGALKRVQGEVIVNVYPFPTSSFYVAAGAYFGGAELLKISGYSDELKEASDAGVIIGDYEIPTDGKGNVKGGLRVKNFRPYLGIGFGRVNPGKFLNFSMELGCQFQGKPEIYTDYGELKETALDDNNTFHDIQKYLKVYPTLTFRLNFRAF